VTSHDVGDLESNAKAINPRVDRFLVPRNNPLHGPIGGVPNKPTKAKIIG
jgi:hypothetical protein